MGYNVEHQPFSVRSRPVKHLDVWMLRLDGSRWELARAENDKNTADGQHNRNTPRGSSHPEYNTHVLIVPMRIYIDGMSPLYKSFYQ